MCGCIRKERRDMYKDSKIMPYTAAVSFAVLTGFSFLGIKACQPFANQLEILTHRYNFAFVAACIVWVTGAFESTIKDKTSKGKPKKMILTAALSYILFMIMQVIGIFYTTSVVGSIIFAITPIIVQIIASIVLKEKSNIKQNFFVTVTVAALIYMIAAGANNLEFNLIGIASLILASLAMAVSNISMRYVRKDYRPFDITLLICGIGFVIFNVVTVVKGVATGTLNEYFIPMQNPTFIIGTAYLGICCILFSSQLMSFALARLPAVNGTIFGNVATAISIVAGVVILDEPFYSYHFICVILIVIGVIGVSIYGDK